MVWRQAVLSPLPGVLWDTHNLFDVRDIQKA
jgi:hypothetical protein